MVTGIIGRKVGMTQLFGEDGSVVPATVIKATQRMRKSMEAGIAYRELVVEGGKGRTNLYGFLPADPNPIVDRFMDEFSATEEDE